MQVGHGEAFGAPGNLLRLAQLLSVLIIDLSAVEVHYRPAASPNAQGGVIECRQNSGDDTTECKAPPQGEIVLAHLVVVKL